MDLRIPEYEHDTDYRRMVVGDYLVFYMVKEESKTVEIHRILHETQNIKHQLSRND